jgi:hypothetical protein
MYVIYIYYDREQTLEADACYTMAKAKLNNYTPNTKLNNYGRACYTMAKAKLNNYTPNTKLNNAGGCKSF